MTQRSCPNPTQCLYYECMNGWVGLDRMSGSPSRANGRAPKRIDLSVLEREQTTGLTGNLLLSANNPRSSLSNGGLTIKQGGLKRAKHDSLQVNTLSEKSLESMGTGGQQNLLPTAMQKPAIVKNIPKTDSRVSAALVHAKQEVAKMEAEKNGKNEKSNSLEADHTGNLLLMNVCSVTAHE